MVEVSEDTTWGRKLLPTSLFSGSKDIMKYPFPDWCIGGEAMACKTFACFWTAWSGILSTSYFLFPVSLGIDCDTGTPSVLFSYCGVASDLLGRSILCMQDTVFHLVCMDLERVESGFRAMLLGVVLEVSLCDFFSVD